jgi:hypothetical protein
MKKKVYYGGSILIIILILLFFIYSNKEMDHSIKVWTIKDNWWKTLSNWDIYEWTSTWWEVDKNNILDL